VTSSLAVFEATIRVKATHLIKSCLQTRKRRKYGNKRYFYTNLHPKDRLDIEFTGELMPEEALTLPYLTHIASLRVRDSY